MGGSNAYALTAGSPYQPAGFRVVACRCQGLKNQGMVREDEATIMGDRLFQHFGGDVQGQKNRANLIKAASQLQADIIPLLSQGSGGKPLENIEEIADQHRH